MKNNYSILALLTVVFLQPVQGQILSVASGTTFTITSGTVFSADSLTLIPASNFSLSGIGITKSTNITNPAANNFISQVYLFSNLTPAFSGTVKFNYADGATLNGIPENSLTLNNFDGGSWRWYVATSRDGAANSVTTTVSNTSFKEITLAAFLNPLPVRWQSFTAVKQGRTILLKWEVAGGQNLQSFTVQHSSDNMHWQSIHTENAAGVINTQNAFSYTHQAPESGNNFYRIAETDLAGKTAYSETKLVKFSNLLSGITILNNPVNQGILKVQVNTPSVLSLHSNDGKLLFKKQYAAGLQEIQVTNFPKGLYLLRSDNSAATILIQ